MRNGKSEVGNDERERSLPISHMACTPILGEIELGPKKWEMRLRRESPSLKFSPQEDSSTHLSRRGLLHSMFHVVLVAGDLYYAKNALIRKYC